MGVRLATNAGPALSDWLNRAASSTPTVESNHRIANHAHELPDRYAVIPRRIEAGKIWPVAERQRQHGQKLIRAKFDAHRIESPAFYPFPIPRQAPSNIFP